MVPIVVSLSHKAANGGPVSLRRFPEARRRASQGGGIRNDPRTTPQPLSLEKPGADLAPNTPVELPRLIENKGLANLLILRLVLYFLTCQIGRLSRIC